jgi:hypothetical protein
MSTQIIVKVLALRHRLRRRDRWTRRQLEAHKATTIDGLQIRRRRKELRRR